MTNFYTMFKVKPEAKSPLSRSKRRWENNIKMIVKKYVVGL